MEFIGNYRCNWKTRVLRMMINNPLPDSQLPSKTKFGKTLQTLARTVTNH